MKTLFIPSVEKGNGTGHLKRCIKYVTESSAESYIYLPEWFLEEISGRPETEEILKPLENGKYICTSLERKYDVIVTDKRNTGCEEYEYYREMAGILVGLDEGGNSRGLYTYLVDTFPSVSEHKANISSTGLLGIKDRRKQFSKSSRINRILISFGGEDPENLTGIFLDSVEHDSFYCDKKIIIVEGPFFKNRFKSRNNIEVVKSPQSLEKNIDESDLVITSFGLTAYEALYSNRYVLLLNPSEYHSRLSSRAGIPETGVKSVDEKVLKKMISSPHLIDKRTKAVLDAPVSLDEIIAGLERTGIADCPFCGGKEIPFKRFRDRNYYRCGKSSLIYMEKFCREKTSYGKDYFFDDYKKQYGRTYLDDFDNIKKMSDSRVNIIKKYCSGGLLLDIGCAYGPFLKSAYDAGFECSGMDVSEDAVEYVKNTLGIDASVEDFSRIEVTEPQKYDVAVMWYVIEHFEDPAAVVGKVKKLLKKGGVFAFSTPNLTGISGRTDMDKTLFRSPYDHYTFWSIGSAAEILRNYGFEILEIRNTGHHPERFSKKIRKIIPETVLKQLSFLLKLGDTFEIYARKTEEQPG